MASLCEPWIFSRVVDSFHLFAVPSRLQSSFPCLANCSKMPQKMPTLAKSTLKSRDVLLKLNQRNPRPNMTEQDLGPERILLSSELMPEGLSRFLRNCGVLDMSLQENDSRGNRLAEVYDIPCTSLTQAERLHERFFFGRPSIRTPRSVGKWRLYPRERN